MFNPFSQPLNPNVNVQGLYENMLKNNPQFAKFVEENKDKTPEEIAKAYNLDPNLIKTFMR